MSGSDQLQYCRICVNRKTDSTFGLICGLTQSKPDFNSECPKFQIDEKEHHLLAEKENDIGEESNAGFTAMRKQGLTVNLAGGLMMVVTAFIWFLAGWSADYIFYYPPILFLIGVFIATRGVLKYVLQRDKHSVE